MDTSANHKYSKDVQAVIVKNLQDPEFLVLKRLNKNTGVYEFRLVKGGVKKDEDVETALLREITEETGIQKVTIIGALKPYSFSYSSKDMHVTHDVTPYLVEAVSKENYGLVDQAEEGGFDIDALLWIRSTDALSIVTYPQEQDLIGQSVELLSKKLQ